MTDRRTHVASTPDKELAVEKLKRTIYILLALTLLVSAIPAVAADYVRCATPNYTIEQTELVYS